MALEEVGVLGSPDVGYRIAHKHHALVLLTHGGQLGIGFGVTVEVGKLMALCRSREHTCKQQGGDKRE